MSNNNNEKLSDLVGDSKSFKFNNDGPLTIFKNKIIAYSCSDNFGGDYGISKIFLYLDRNDKMELWYRNSNSANEGGTESFKKDAKLLELYFED